MASVAPSACMPYSSEQLERVASSAEASRAEAAAEGGEEDEEEEAEAGTGEGGRQPHDDAAAAESAG